MGKKEEEDEDEDKEEKKSEQKERFFRNYAASKQASKINTGLMSVCKRAWGFFALLTSQCDLHYMQ